LTGFDSSFYRGPFRETVLRVAARRDFTSLALLVAWQALTAAGFAWELARRDGGRQP
jgi:hypothetical protein